MLGLEDHFTAEIEFWKDMIESRNENACEATLERMKQALALAERKLLLLTADRPGTPGNPGREH